VAGFQAYTYSVTKYNTFGDLNGWLEAFLQNLVGNIIYFNSIYLKVTAASAANNVA
jgi:hypothetical protein